MRRLSCSRHVEAVINQISVLPILGITRPVLVTGAEHVMAETLANEPGLSAVQVTGAMLGAGSDMVVTPYCQFGPLSQYRIQDTLQNTI